MCQGVCWVLELESERGRKKEVGRVKGRLVKWETQGESTVSCPITSTSYKRRRNGIEKGKKSMETDNQQCCLFCCVSIVFYLLFCLIYGSLYNEGVLQIHGCWEPLSFRVASTHFHPRSSLLFYCFIHCLLTFAPQDKKKNKQSVCSKVLLSLLVITWSPLSLVQVEVSVRTKVSWI